MKISHNTIVTLDYTVTTPDGTMVDEGQEPLIYVHGGYDNIFETVEKGLEGKGVGDTFKIPLTAAQAFGEYDDELLVLESLDNLPDNLSVGTQIEGSMDGDEDDIVLYTVTEIRDDNHAVLDGNHPLAGLNLVFEGTVTEIHPATDEEIKALLHHGHGNDCGCGDH